MLDAASAPTSLQQQSARWVNIVTQSKPIHIPFRHLLKKKIVWTDCLPSKTDRQSYRATTWLMVFVGYQYALWFWQKTYPELRLVVSVLVVLHMVLRWLQIHHLSKMMLMCTLGNYYSVLILKLYGLPITLWAPWFLVITLFFRDHWEAEPSCNRCNTMYLFFVLSHCPPFFSPNSGYESLNSLISLHSHTLFCLHRACVSEPFIGKNPFSQ